LVEKESDASGSTAHLAMRDLQASMGGVERLSELGSIERGGAALVAPVKVFFFCKDRR
jgi:hypothetical protein